jgi:two-component system sensor histidine kinase KdpD
MPSKDLTPEQNQAEQLEEPLRPAAAEALRRLQAEEQPRKRGRLRLLLGAAPGVGKTYAMLLEGRQRKAEGQDVVVGLLETHGRQRTQEAAGGLEVLPRRKIPYKGITVEEMDTESIIARHPELVLIDELAHSNAPGSRHEKRWQDVHEILDAGIDVIGTLNIQHLESLNDVVESITGVKVRETIPDSVVDEADELQLVDVPPETLQERLQRGEIYPSERAIQALNNYFRKGNLAALREIALRRMALDVEEDIEDYREQQRIAAAWPSQERVMVGLDHRPISRQLVRNAARLARGLRADLLAVTVGDCTRLSAEECKALAANQQLAEDLGATCYTVPGGDVAEALVRFAREHNVTQVVIGQSARSRLDILLRGSTINKILREARNVDVHVVADRSTH